MQEKGIFEYFKEGVTLKYMDFNGRARRREYWSYALCAFVIGFVAGLIDGLIGLHSILSSIVGLAFLLPGLAIAVRRLHDIGKDWKYLLIALIPFGAFYLIYLFVQDSQPGDNAYGPNPKGLEVGHRSLHEHTHKRLLASPVLLAYTRIELPS